MPGHRTDEKTRPWCCLGVASTLGVRTVAVLIVRVALDIAVASVASVTVAVVLVAVGIATVCVVAVHVGLLHASLARVLTVTGRGVVLILHVLRGSCRTGLELLRKGRERRWIRKHVR